MKTKLKCGIVGYGYMGKIRQAVIERHTDDLDLIGVCEVNETVRETISGAPAFTSFDQLLKADPDIIFVCTPNLWSPEITIKSMKAGKHVFCEKPPGRNIQDIRNIRDAETKGVTLMFGFNHRFHPGITKAKALVDSGRFGRILGLRGIYGKSGGLNFDKSWRNDRSVSGGGILLDQGIHMLDLFRYFCGDFERVKCFASNAFWKFDLEDNAFVILQNQQKQSACLHSSATLWKHTFQVDIILEEGYLIVEGLLSKSGSYGREKLIVGRRQFENEAHAVGNPSEEVTYFDKDLSWDLEVEAFLRCVREGTEVSQSSSYDALKVMEIVESAYKDAGLMGERVPNEEHSYL